MRLFERMPADYAAIGLIAAVVFGARLLSFGYLSSLAHANPTASPYPIVAGDSTYYARWADTLLAFHAYEDPPGKPLHAAPPGYPALLAATKAATGSMTPIIIVQIILAAYASVLIYRMARTLVPGAFALVPALAYGIDPMAVFADSALMTDGLFSALMVCTVYLAFFLPAQAGKSRLCGAMRWGLVGILLGIATMLRPIAEFLILVFPAMYLIRERMRGVNEDESRVKAIGACVLAFILVVVPWMIRNEKIFGAFEISPLGGHNLLTNNVRGFLAWRALADTPDPMPAILVMRHVNDPVFAAVSEKMNRDLAGITPPGKDPANYEGPLAMSYIVHDPIRYAYFHAVNTAPFFLSSSIASYGQIVRQLRDNEGFFAPVSLSLLDAWGRIRHPESAGSFISAARALLPIASEMFWWFVVTLLALAAVVLRRREFAIVLCAVLVVYFAALTGPMSNSRYRIPAEPYLLILAIAGTHALMERMKGKTV